MTAPSECAAARQHVIASSTASFSGGRALSEELLRKIQAHVMDCPIPVSDWEALKRRALSSGTQAQRASAQKAFDALIQAQKDKNHTDNAWMVVLVLVIAMGILNSNQ